MRSEPSDDCSLNWRACERHASCTMMQIFSLKLAYPPAGDQVKVYGFMAVRDTRDHLRNYIFNRTRVEQDDGFIQLSGPKRGIWWYDKQLVEFDMRIKRGDNEADDPQLIDGAVWFYDGCSPHAKVLTQRIDGDYGSVDISYTLLQTAMEATVQIAASELDRDIGLLVRAYYVSDLLHQGMQLFDGVFPADAAAGVADRYELDKYVVAASRRTKLALQLRIRSLDDDVDAWRYCLSPASKHGTDDFSFALSFATIDVKISWSTLD
ncbi:uncharacterized protein LOC123450817 [Hordeum vulgare subsp. vulgare]|nr:uncharacterized protein LOC123450817 [Hordeum vulgare subsp. vulgare]